MKRRPKDDTFLISTQSPYMMPIDSSITCMHSANPPRSRRRPVRISPNNVCLHSVVQWQGSQFIVTQFNLCRHRQRQISSHVVEDCSIYLSIHRCQELFMLIFHVMPACACACIILKLTELGSVGANRRHQAMQ